MSDSFYCAPNMILFLDTFPQLGEEPLLMLAILLPPRYTVGLNIDM
jgi:hypothetical protein